MQSADVAVVGEDYSTAVAVARRMPPGSALPLAARSRHLTDVAHAQVRLGNDRAAEAALLTLERGAPDWTAHHRLPLMLVGELLTRRRPSVPRAHRPDTRSYLLSYREWLADELGPLAAWTTPSATWTPRTADTRITSTR